MMGTEESAPPKGTNSGNSGQFSYYGSKRNYCCVPTETVVEELPTWEVMGQNKYVLTPYDVSNGLNKKIILYKGDITKIKADAVVNAANSYLRGGGGVDGSIHDAAGRELYQYLCYHYKHCDTGDFKPTPGFQMPCKEILHGVGPIGENPRMLRQVYLRCMEYVKIKEMKTIAFPCISTGIYGYRNSRACPVVLKIIREWLEVNNDWDGKIIFCCYSSTDFNIYMDNLPYFFPTMEVIEKPIEELNEELIEEQTMAKEVNGKLMKCVVEEKKQSLEQEKERIARKKEIIAKEIEEFKKEDEEEKERMKQVIEKQKIKDEKIRVKLEEKKRQKEEEQSKRKQIEERQKMGIDSSDQEEFKNEEKSVEERKKMLEEFVGEVAEELENSKPRVEIIIDAKEKQGEIEQTKDLPLNIEKKEIPECCVDQEIDNDNTKPKNIEIQQDNVEEQVEGIKVVDNVKIDENVENIENVKETSTLNNDKEVLNEENTQNERFK